MSVGDSLRLGGSRVGMDEHERGWHQWLANITI